MRDPANPNNIIDMRHFTVIGPKGNVYGLGVEVMQGLMSLKDPSFSDSAFNFQDFYSNNLGTTFFGNNTLKPNQLLAPPLEQYFQNRLPTPTGTSGSTSFLGGGSNAFGGFVIYPNKSNTNMTQSVYAK